MVYTNSFRRRLARLRYSLDLALRANDNNLAELAVDFLRDLASLHAFLKYGLQDGESIFVDQDKK